MKVPPELQTARGAEVEAVHLLASPIVQERMCGLIEPRREECDYESFLSRKVEAGRASIALGRRHDNVEVEIEFSARRAKATRRT